MIKTNELRIGNWIELKTSEPVKVDIDNLSDVVNNPAIFNPIPLTPEILEKAGFTVPEYEEDWEDDETGDHPHELQMDVNITDVCSGNIWYATGKRHYEKGFYLWAGLGSPDSYGFYCPHIEYVHQLQNLYFVLTNTELNISL